MAELGLADWVCAGGWWLWRDGSNVRAYVEVSTYWPRTWPADVPRPAFSFPVLLLLVRVHALYA